MKILLVSKFHSAYGGATRSYLDTARVLESHGHEVAYFAMKQPESFPTKWSKYFVDPVDYNNPNLPLWQKVKMASKIIFNFEAQRKIDALIRDFQPDIVHLHNFFHQISPSILWTIKKHGIPMVMTLHDYKTICPNQFMFVRGKIWEGGAFRCVLDRCVKDSYAKSLVAAIEFFLHKTILKSYDLVDVFISPTKFLIEKHKEHNFKGVMHHIPYMLDERDFDEVKDAQKSSAPYILYMGRLSTEKGIEVIFDAIKDLEISLYVAGSGPDETLYKKLAEPLGEKVQFLGNKNREELRSLVRGARAVVVPSIWYENYPFVVLEALAAGGIVIASRFGGMLEQVQEGENGFMFEKGNSKELKLRIKEVLNLSEAERSKICQNAKQSVRHLTASNYYASLMKVYNAIFAQ